MSSATPSPASCFDRTASTLFWFRSTLLPNSTCCSRPSPTLFCLVALNRTAVPLCPSSQAPSSRFQRTVARSALLNSNRFLTVQWSCGSALRKFFCQTTDPSVTQQPPEQKGGATQALTGKIGCELPVTPDCTAIQDAVVPVVAFPISLPARTQVPGCHVSHLYNAGSL